MNRRDTARRSASGRVSGQASNSLPNPFFPSAPGRRPGRRLQFFPRRESGGPARGGGSFFAPAPPRFFCPCWRPRHARRHRRIARTRRRRFVPGPGPKPARRGPRPAAGSRDRKAARRRCLAENHDRRGRRERQRGRVDLERRLRVGRGRARAVPAPFWARHAQQCRGRSRRPAQDARNARRPGGPGALPHAPLRGTGAPAAVLHAPAPCLLRVAGRRRRSGRYRARTLRRHRHAGRSRRPVPGPRSRRPAPERDRARAGRTARGAFSQNPRHPAQRRIHRGFSAAAASDSRADEPALLRIARRGAHPGGRRPAPPALGLFDAARGRPWSRSPRRTACPAAGSGTPLSPA